MATTQSPYGLRLAKSMGQRRQGHGFNQYPIASGYATDLKTGDLVTLVAPGTINKFTQTTTASPAPIGVFMGVSYTDASLGYIQKQQWVSGTVASNAMAYVIDDPEAVFQMQANGSLNNNAVGTNAAVVQGTGNLTLGVSGVSLNAGSIAATATLPIRIVGMVNEVGFSVPGDAFTDVLVRINIHFNSSTTGNAGA
jgi:hypothetical protein